jgi:CRISPR/Cas system-associated exonuclease Cas4 (RecB family)
VEKLTPNSPATPFDIKSEGVSSLELKHSIISPSGASRWMACTSSAYFEKMHGQNLKSDYASEGTLAHEIAEVLLKYEMQDPAARPELKKRFDDLIKQPEFYEGMIEEVEIFVDECARLGVKNSLVFIEKKVSLGFISAGMKGTVDFGHYQKETKKLTVIDLKFGLGIKVSAVDNKQLQLYAAGLYAEINNLGFEVSSIEIKIIQPRLEKGISYDLITNEQLRYFINFAQTKAFLAVSSPLEATFNAGEHCVFCSAKAKCNELALLTTLTYDKAVEYFQTYGEIDASDYLYYLEIRPDINRFYTAITNEIERKLLAGEQVLGFKLVEGRATRYFTDSEMVRTRLLGMGYKEENITETKLLSLTAIEKLMGVKNFKDLNSLVDKKKGKLTVATEKDIRLQVSGGAEIDFKDL